MVFIRQRKRGHRTYYEVIESRRVEGKRHPVHTSLLFLGEEPDIERHIAETRRRLAGLRRTRRKCEALQRFAARNTAPPLDDPEAAGLAATMAAQGRAFARAVVAIVIEDVADAEAHLAKLREVRRKLKVGVRLR